MLREADETPVAEVAKKCKISAQTIYKCAVISAPWSALDIKRLRALEGLTADAKCRERSKRRSGVCRFWVR